MKSQRSYCISVLSSQRRNLAQLGLLDLRNSRIDDFSFLGTQKTLKILDIRGSNVVSLHTLEAQPSLVEIKADDSQLQSLAGLSIQPRLMKISYANTPFGMSEYNRIASVVCIGPRLSYINDIPVSKRERLIAGAYPPIASYFIENGWEISIPPPSEDDFRSLAEQFDINAKDKDFKFPYKFPEIGDDLAETGPETSEARPRQEGLSDRLCAILRPLGFGIRSGPEMHKDIVSAVGALCGALKVIEESGEASKSGIK